MSQEPLPIPGPEPGPALDFETQAQRITVDVQSRQVRFFYVADYELTLLRWASPALPLAFLGIAASSAISFAIVVSTVTTLDPSQRAVFTGLTWASGLVGIFFLLVTIGAWILNEQVAQAIRRRPTATSRG